MKKIVLADLGRHGLGNKLLIWAKAFLYSEYHKSRLVTNGFWHIPFGSVIRNEKTKRFYFNYFQNDFILTERLFFIIFNTFFSKESNISISKLSDKSVILFNRVPDEETLFDEIKSDRLLIREKFYKTINSSVLNRLHNVEYPILGVHLRRGDFVESIQTKEDKFIQIIKEIRTLSGRNLEVTIFTDGDMKQIPKLVNLGNIKVIQTGNDLLDLLLLSKSKVIIPSMRSTFSYWASFISESLIIRFKEDHCGPIIDTQSNLNQLPREIIFPFVSDTIKMQIKRTLNQE